MGEEKEDSTCVRTFQLRPSILSGECGFGSPMINNSAASPKKDFLLRPSSLASASDGLDNTLNKSTKKRLHNTDETDLRKDDEIVVKEAVKKAKVVTEVDKEEPLKLTEDIKKPTGIGTFGFANQEKVEINESNKEKQFQTPNYFTQTTSPSGKLKFVFGSKNTTSDTPVAFSCIKDQNSDADSDNNSKDFSHTEKGSEKSKLLENADMYQRAHDDQRRHYEEVECITGEEGEKHVLQILCRLHLFDKEKKLWREKGRGTLKLNDICQSDGVFQSRLVFRMQGTNIVQLNTFLYPDMCCEEVKEKSIRLSALDPESKEINLFLITCNLKDRYPTFTAIERRIHAIRNRNKGTAQTISTNQKKEEVE